jgi:hypothetical protein
MAGWNFEYTIDVDTVNRIVTEKIFGVWKEETARSFVEEYEKEVADLIDQSWVRLCDLSNWKTATPEVINIIGRHLRWCREHNMAWSVNIIDNPVTYGQLQRMFDKGGTREISRTFRDRKEGEKFLRDKGFSTNGAPSGTPFRR